MILVYTKFDQSSPSAQTKSLHKVYTQSLLKVYTPSIIVYTKFDYPPHPSWTPTSALRVGPYGRLEVRRRAGCTPTAHGTVGGPLVGAPGAFGTTRFCRPTLPGRPLRPSASAHTAGRRSGGGPAALPRPMGRSGGPWLGLRERLAPPGFAAPPCWDHYFGPPQLAIWTSRWQAIQPQPATQVIL